MSDSSNSSSNSSAASAASRGTTAKAKKNAERARLTARRANLASVRENLTAKFTKLPAELRAQAQAKLREIRGDPDMDSAERAAAEEKYMAKVKRAVDRAVAAKEAEKEAKKAEAAAKREAAKSARAAATTARREEKERETARAMANLKEYLGESPKKKNVNAFLKARKNARNMTARNFAKAAGIRRTKKLSESAKKALKKRDSVAKDFKAKGFTEDESEGFCSDLLSLASLKARLEAMHKEKKLKHSLSTITEVCKAVGERAASVSNSVNSENSS